MSAAHLDPGHLAGVSILSWSKWVKPVGNRVRPGEPLPQFALRINQARSFFCGLNQGTQVHTYPLALVPSVHILKQVVDARLLAPAPFLFLTTPSFGFSFTAGNLFAVPALFPLFIHVDENPKQDLLDAVFQP